MKNLKIATTAAAALMTAGVAANAQTTLGEIGVNIDGKVYDNPFNTTLGYTPTWPPPSSATISGFDGAGTSQVVAGANSGFGTIHYTVSGPGTHSFYALLDIEADNGAGWQFEKAMGNGTQSVLHQSGLSWEYGDYSVLDPITSAPVIYDDFAAGSLANTTGTVGPVDVAAALGFGGFSLGAGQTATIDIYSSDTAPDPKSLFYIDQWNPNESTPPHAYIYATLDITGSSSVPDGGATFGLLTLASAGLLEAKRRLGRS